ncbi:hypothetical protein PHISCL_11176, partial [Aspergillus sclerotialis]
SSSHSLLTTYPLTLTTMCTESVVPVVLATPVCQPLSSIAVTVALFVTSWSFSKRQTKKFPASWRILLVKVLGSAVVAGDV